MVDDLVSSVGSNVSEETRKYSLNGCIGVLFGSESQQNSTTLQGAMDGKGKTASNFSGCRYFAETMLVKPKPKDEKTYFFEDAVFESGNEQARTHFEKRGLGR